jgi:hypothetical protein
MAAADPAAPAYLVAARQAAALRLGSSTPIPSNWNFAVPNVCEVCSNEETVCAHYAFRNGQCVTEICPPTAPPSGTRGRLRPGNGVYTRIGMPWRLVWRLFDLVFVRFYRTLSVHTGCSTSPGAGPSPCMQGASCQPNSGCGTAVPAGSNQCSTSCSCDPTGNQCSEYCPDASPASGCAQGTPCPPGGNSVCGGGAIGGCSFSCSCDGTGHLQCSSSCPADASIATDASDG